jgi:hypothetical protein
MLSAKRSNPAASAIDTESVFIITIRTLERDDFGAASCTSLITDFDRLLMTLRAISPLDSIELFFLLFEVIDIPKD